MEPHIPLMAKGTVIPPYVYEKMRLEEENQKLREELKRIADGVSVQADLAVKQSEDAEKSALKSKVRSNISLVLSAGSLIAVLLTNADKIVHNVQQILSHLGLL